MSKGSRGNKEAKKPKKTPVAQPPEGSLPVVAPAIAGQARPRKR